MKADRLLDLYERVIDAPDAILRLRRFITEIAVRGLLVPQNPNDEPASELLKRIAAEKNRLASFSVPRGTRSDGRERTKEFEISLPPGWALSTLGSVALKITDGAHHTPTYVGSGVPFVSVKDFSAGSLNLANTRLITEAEHRRLYKRCDPKRGDILIGRIGTLGRAVLIDSDIEFSMFVSVGLIRFSHENIAPEYFRTLLNSPLVEAEFNRIKIGGGTHTNKLNLGDLRTVAFPLPPLSEQHRIVSKVNELMTLCDRLEAVRAEREVVRDKVAAATFARLNTLNAETSRVDACFALEALPVLTNRSDQVKQLRQTILTLAFLGRLVPQRPDEGTGRALLTTILEMRPLGRRIGGRIRHGREPLDPLNCPGVSEIPSTWQWAYLDCLCEQIADVDHKMPRAVSSGVPFISARDLKDDGSIDFENAKQIAEEDFRRLSRKLQMRQGDIVYSRIGTIGKARIVARDVRFIISYSCCLIRPLKEYLDVHYVQQFLESVVALSQAGKSTTGIGVPDLGLGEIKQFNVPLPPRAEQQRIVAKVDELMALCDRLEASLTSGENIRNCLFESLLHEALAPTIEKAA